MNSRSPCYEVKGFDLSPASREAARARGVFVVAAAPDVTVGADVVLTMLPAGGHVLSVWKELVIGVHLKGSFNVSRAAAPHFKEQACSAKLLMPRIESI